MPLTYHQHQGRTIQKAPESEVPVQQSVSASTDTAVQVNVSPTSAVGVSTTENLEVVTTVQASSTVGVGQSVNASTDTASQPNVSPTSSVGVSSSTTTEINTPTSGPTFSDGAPETFTKEGSNTASHSASWNGSAAPYTLEVYKSSSEQFLIYKNTGISGTSDNPSSYTTLTGISSLSFGDSVHFKVQDGNGNTATESVLVSVSSFS